LGIILPICIYLFLATRNVDSIPLSRGWGSLGSGLTIAPLLGIFLEFGSLTLVFTFIMVFMMQDSSLLTELEIAATRLTSGQENPEILSNMLAAFIRHPINRFLIFSIIAGVVPIIEEIVKQIPIWLLAWRKLTPRTGLMMGTLGGAGFALTESLLSVSVIGGSDQWVYQIIGRAGAGLMHMITGALCGWGLSSAIEGKSYIKAILTYLTSVIIHGLWNAMATWEGLGRIANPSTLTSFSFLDPNQFPLIVMGILFLLMAYILIFHKNILKD
jgi:RsiW-degrading membrane proteinase PrsW (M82 family)